MLYEYDGIKMVMVKTNRVEFNAIYTDDRSTYLYTNYNIDIQATINPFTMAYTGGDGAGVATEMPGGSFPATTIKAIRHKLMQPRRRLLVIDESRNVLLDTPREDSESDVKNGPIPLSCSLINISGARTILLRWQCEGWIRECPDTQDLLSPSTFILSTRWSDQMTINEYQLATRVIIGHTVFDKSYIDFAGTQPDDYRDRIGFPGVHSQFQRKKLNIVQSSDGTELDWQIIDEERMWVLGETKPDISGQGPQHQQGQFGSGILEIDGVQSVMANKPPDNTALIGNTINNIQLRAKGSFYANQWNMIQRLLQLASTLTPQLMVAGGGVVNPQGNYYFSNAAISRSLGQSVKWVQLELSIICPPPDAVRELAGNVNVLPVTVDIWNAMDNKIPQYEVSIEGETVSRSPGLLRDSESRGSSPARLITQFLTESCLEPAELPTVELFTEEQEGPGNIAAQDDKTPDDARNTVTTIPSKYDKSTVGSFPYTVYSIVPRMMTNQGIKQFPITGPPPDSSGSTQGSSAGTTGLARIHLPVTRFRYEGIAERVGAFPLLPNPVPSNPDEYVLLSWHISPYYPVPAYDGVTPVYRADFEYEYAKRTALDPTNPVIPLGKLPFSLFPASQTGPQNFSTDDMLGLNQNSGQSGDPFGGFL